MSGNWSISIELNWVLGVWRSQYSTSKRDVYWCWSCKRAELVAVMLCCSRDFSQKQPVWTNILLRLTPSLALRMTGKFARNVINHFLFMPALHPVKSSIHESVHDTWYVQRKENSSQNLQHSFLTIGRMPQFNRPPRFDIEVEYVAHPRAIGQLGIILRLLKLLPLCYQFMLN